MLRGEEEGEGEKWEEEEGGSPELWGEGEEEVLLLVFRSEVTFDLSVFFLQGKQKDKYM